MTQPVQFPWETPRHYGPYPTPYNNKRSTNKPARLQQGVIQNTNKPSNIKQGTVLKGYTSSITSVISKKSGLSNATKAPSYNQWFRKPHTIKTPKVVYGNKGTMHGRNTTNFVKSKGGASSIVRSGGASLSIMKHGGGGMGNFSK